MQLRFISLFAFGLSLIILAIFPGDVLGNAQYVHPDWKRSGENCRCPRNWNPVCTRHNQTYYNYCFMACYVGGVQKHEGLCTRTHSPVKKGRCHCPKNIAFVCGNNGRTYYNSCLMKCDDQTKKHNGTCEAGPGEPGSWPWEEESIQPMLKVRNASLDCSCGVPTGDEAKADGSKAVDANPYEYGWMAYVGSILGHCAGTIINDRTILTAAHCVVSPAYLENLGIKPEDRIKKAQNITVILNTHKRLGDERGIRKYVQKVLVHPGYIPTKLKGGWDYDLALLVLNETLEFSRLSPIRPICLPQLGEEVKTIGERAMVTGWGRRSSIGWSYVGGHMKKLALTIEDLAVCRNMSQFDDSFHNFLCAGTLHVKTDPYPGDSGGPLQIKREDHWTQVGVGSWIEGYSYPVPAPPAPPAPAFNIFNLFQSRPLAQGPSREGRFIVLYQDLTNPITLQFINYHANETGAGWCKLPAPNNTAHASHGPSPIHSVNNGDALKHHTTKKPAGKK